MRVLLWHGWLLDGTGSNVYTAKTAEVMRCEGHDVLLLCQEPEPERFPFVDAWSEVGEDGVGLLRPTGAAPAAGRLILLRPDIGKLLPVFVLDDYHGFEVKRFVDLSDDELEGYMARNVEAIRVAAGWHLPEIAITGHVVPGAPVMARALDGIPFVAKIHGSDLEYAIRLQPRYRRLAAEGLAMARSVVGATHDVTARTLELVPGVEGKLVVVPPGVEVHAFVPRDRAEALREVAGRLAGDPQTALGRPDALDDEVREAVADRDGGRLDALAARYDHRQPDPSAAARLAELAGPAAGVPLIGYLGKFIPQKGVDLLLQALPLLSREVRTVLVGFGSSREWLTALAFALDGADADALRWLAGSSPLAVEPDLDPAQARGLASRTLFTGRLDHRYAPGVLAALDVLVVPSILDEAFGMVAAEGAATGALPLVARHSGLAEVAGTLERAVGRPGLFSFEPGPGAHHRIAEGLDTLLALPPQERRKLRAGVAEAVRSEWTWERTAERLLGAALGVPPQGGSETLSPAVAPAPPPSPTGTGSGGRGRRT